MKRRGKKADAVNVDEGEEQFVPGSPGGNGGARGGRGGSASGTVSRSSKDVVHHHPPQEAAKDVGYPVRGGQTLLIAYFPWEASEADIEREFSKFCRVKRVHLVVDKSSRKPRCFGFVKFSSKVDAERALMATTKGLVQLPDTRGHVWHLKAEWSKSGDMVVDDSETEQEVAKRKEERRSRTEQRGTTGPLAITDTPDTYSAQPKSAKWPSAAVKASLHPGVPAPLPPLQPRYSASPVSMGIQGQMPVMQAGQSHLGVVGAMNAQASHLAPQGQVQQMLPAHQSVPQNQGVPQQVYHAQQGQHMYTGTASSPPMYGSLGGAAQQLPRDNNASVQLLNQGAGNLPQDAPAHGGNAQAVLRDQLAASQSYSSAPQAYATSQQAYGTAQQGYAAPAQGYTQQPQAYVTAQQQGQQAYATSQQGYATGHHAYAPQQSAYAPQAQAYVSPQPGANYGNAAAGYSPQAYAGYSMGQSMPQQGHYGYVQQAAPAPAPSGVLAYGGYPAGPAPGAPVQPQVVVHAGDDPSQESATMTIAGVPHVVVSPAAQSSFMPATQLAQSQVQCSSAGSAPSQTAMGEMAPAHPNAGAGITTPPGGTMPHPVAAPVVDAPYLDMVWHLSEMSLHDKAAVAVQQVPAPPAQQPSVPYARRNVMEAMQHFSTMHGLHGAAGPSAVWNSFDDAAAKGMVDGLVGREDGVAPLVTTWNPHVV